MISRDCAAIGPTGPILSACLTESARMATFEAWLQQCATLMVYLNVLLEAAGLPIEPA